MTAKTYYNNQPKHYIGLDSIIFGFDNNSLKLLLIKRKFEPEQGKWSLMGGFLQENESVDQAAQRILNTLTGLSDVYLEQLTTYGELNRDTAGRVVSVAYYSLINTKMYDNQKGEEHGAKWFDINEIPDLIFDHNEMVNRALKRLQRRTKTEPIGFELLPDKFTIPQLQHLYEAIQQRKLDKRNFRKKILSMGVLQKLEEKDKTSSKKGAFLHEFDEVTYLKLKSEGFLFEA